MVSNMTKILLVEDDKSLREIYGVRLLAEGYDIISAGDGEEALAMAIKDRPSLIVSDVMMPKISGFDMLDILRSTTETKDIKVIMMTALSSEDQRKRGEQLGADRYLVKSQVGIEDVVRAVHDVLGDAPTSSSGASAFSAPAPSAVPRQAAPATTPSPRPTAPVTAAPPAPSVQPSVPPTPSPQPAPSAPAMPQPTAPFSTPRPASLADRVIQPVNDLTQSTDLSEKMDKELDNHPLAPAPSVSSATPTAPAPSAPSTPPAAPPLPPVQPPAPPQSGPLPPAL